MVYSGQIQAYDFGTVAENMLHYGQVILKKNLKSEILSN